MGQTAEGINTIVQVRGKAEELDVYMPITNALYEVIFEGAPPLNIALSLMKTDTVVMLNLFYLITKSEEEMS